MNNISYFNNAATSWPKPEGVRAAMTPYLCGTGGSPSRSGHRLSIEALNLALRGLLKTGDHVITSSVEHNSVMRPIRALEKEGVELSVLPCSIRESSIPTRSVPSSAGTRRPSSLPTLRT